MKKIILIILLFITAEGLFSQEDSLTVRKDSNVFTSGVFLLGDTVEMIDWFAIQEDWDTAYINVALISRSGAIHVVPGMLIIHGMRARAMYGWDDVFSRKFLVKKNWGKGFREVSEKQIWDYKPIGK